LIFLDSNVLVYASGIHGDEEIRTTVARQIVTDAQPYVVSVQVLQEFYDRVTRPAKTRVMSHADAVAFVAQWRTFLVVPMTTDVFDKAIELRGRTNYRYYDCSIIAAAIEAGCTSLLTEDMQDGQVIDGVRIVDPFTKG